MSTDKIVTHADLPAIDALENRVPREWSRDEIAAVESLLARVRAAAEADAPPLPEGWVLHTTPAGSRAVFWHRDGYLYQWDDGRYVSSRPVQPFASSKTVPFRPTVTGADVEAARQALPLGASRDMVRAAFEAAGIEVQS